MGMGVGPIPFTSVDSYARRYRIDGADDFDAFRELVRAMDGVYLTWSNNRSGKKPT